MTEHRELLRECLDRIEWADEDDPLYHKISAALAQQEDREKVALRQFYEAWKRIKDFGGRYTIEMAEAEEDIAAVGSAMPAAPAAGEGGA